MRLFFPARRRVIVNTRTDKAFRGVLWRCGWRFLVLRNVELLKSRGEALPMDGELVVERANVDFIQVVA